MSSVPPADPALHLAIAFLNTYDLLEPQPELLSLARLERTTRDCGFPGIAARIAHLGEEDLLRLRRIRDGLYPIFAAPEHGMKVQALNAALAHADVAPRVITEPGGAVRLAATPSSATPTVTNELSALIVDAIAHAMTVGGPERFGTCVGDPCRCVYVDRTRAGRQRFCCQLCNDRMAAAAYRSRKAVAL
jgi:hypothetical protein